MRAQDKWCKLSDIPLYEDTLTRKANNIIRTFIENIDGCVVPDKKKNRNDKNKHKQTCLNNLLSRLETCMFGALETQQPWDLFTHSQSLHK